MKKSVLSLMILVLSLIIFPNTIMASEKAPMHLSNNTIPIEIRVMIDRLNEIKEMDKSSLKSDEKKVLRKEVRAIKKTIRASGNGIYISSGAIIIILLLIIIF
tara:strand:- start:64694 stop:65002 length:309 start_codon:yes stop_codon:yes gene_type:complete